MSSLKFKDEHGRWQKSDGVFSSPRAAREHAGIIGARTYSIRAVRKKKKTLMKVPKPTRLITWRSIRDDCPKREDFSATSAIEVVGGNGTRCVIYRYEQFLAAHSDFSLQLYWRALPLLATPEIPSAVDLIRLETDRRRARNLAGVPPGYTKNGVPNAAWQDGFHRGAEFVRNAVKAVIVKEDEAGEGYERAIRASLASQVRNALT